ncbi:unnamed protein product, partial [Meganyctiphanes norvegica]
GLGGPGGREPWDGRIMSEQHFCLRWNNFQSNIASSFEALLDREELVDVTLTAEGESLKAHRILLSACSHYFRDLFRELPSHQHPIIVLHDTCFTELKSLLHFIYHGEVNVSQERLGLLLKLAEALRIKGLAQDKKSRENDQFGSQCISPEKEPEEGLDRGRSGGPGSPALSLVGFPGVTGLPPGNPLVPLEPPSHKPQPPHLLHSSPPAKRRKSIRSSSGGPILLPLSTPQRESLNSHHPPPVSTLSSQDDECSPRVINLTMGNNGPSPPPKISVVPKTELQEDGEGESGRGGNGNGGGSGGSGGGEGSSDHEDDLKEEEDMENDSHLNTTPHDLSGLPPHLTAAVQNFVPYAAAAAAAAGSSQLDNYPGPSGVMPPASQPGWRGGPHSDSTDTSAQVESCKRNPCPLCNCTLDSVWALKDHLARRHDMKVHKCVFCGAKFREVEQMAVHMSKRHGEKLAGGETRIPGAVGPGPP